MIKKNYFNTFYSTICVVATCLVGICRCFKFNNIYVLIACIGLVTVCLFFKHRISITVYDIIIFLLPFIVFFHKYETYYWSPCFFYLLACLAFFTFRTEKNINTVLKTLAAFSLLNILVNIINIINPGIYTNIITLLLNKSSIESNLLYYKTFGYMSGLSDHYSRNAYYCVLGGTIFAANYFANHKKKMLFAALAILEIAMIMVIGKRGHLLFVVAAVMITYILMAPDISKKLLNFLRLFSLLFIVLGFLIEFVPAVSFVIERMLSLQAFGDVSNGRIVLWKLAIDAFKEKPVFGWGYGYFNSTFVNEWQKVNYAGVHNDYLQWLCEIGIIGFIPNIIITIGIYRISIKELKAIVGKNKRTGSLEQVMIIWSVIFQTFIILYSFTGLPHFDYEINVVYYLSLAVPMILLKKTVCSDIKVWRKTLKW